MLAPVKNPNTSCGQLPHSLERCAFKVFSSKRRYCLDDIAPAISNTLALCLAFVVRGAKTHSQVLSLILFSTEICSNVFPSKNAVSDFIFAGGGGFTLGGVCITFPRRTTLPPLPAPPFLLFPHELEFELAFVRLFDLDGLGPMADSICAGVLCPICLAPSLATLEDPVGGGRCSQC